ncbi:hypothetical protein PO909_010320 [Leuciscus waleckii]
MVTGQCHRSQRDCRWSYSVWAVSGERRGNSGSKRGSIPLKWATLVVTPQTRPMRRCAQVKQGTQRWFAWSICLRKSTLHSCSRYSGKATILHKECARATMLERPIDQPSTHTHRNNSPRHCAPRTNIRSHLRFGRPCLHGNKGGRAASYWPAAQTERLLGVEGRL